MSDSTLPQPNLQFAMLIKAHISEVIKVGAVADGVRTHFSLQGCSIKGPRLNAELLTGADRFLMRTDGVPFVDALYEIKTDDGVMITVHNSGPALPATSAGLAHTTLRFTAPTGQHDWLNKANFVGTLKAEMADGYVLVRVDQVL